MERLDAVVAGLGVLVVAVALGGVVASGPGSGPEFRVVFVEQPQPQEAQMAALAGDGSVDVPLEVATPNLTRLQVTVRVTGSGPRAAADSIEVTLAGPDGRSETQQATLAAGGPADASVTFERPLRALPPEQRVRAASPEAAVAAADPGASPANASGTWTVTVGIAGGGLPQLHVEGHDIVVEATAYAFRATVQPEVVPR